MEISVVGRAEASAQPEVATLRVALEADGTSAQDVVARVSALAASLEADLAEQSARAPSPVVSSAVLPAQTRSWQPYDPDGRPLPTRFTATAQLVVTYRQVQALSETADGWGRRDGVQVHSVEWQLRPDTRDALQARLLTEAVHDAYARARIIAAAAGAGDVTVLQISDPDLPGRPAPREPMLAFAAKSAGDSAIAAHPQDLELSAQVHARFRAEPLRPDGHSA